MIHLFDAYKDVAVTFPLISKLNENGIFKDSGHEIVVATENLDNVFFKQIISLLSSKKLIQEHEDRFTVLQKEIIQFDLNKDLIKLYEYSYYDILTTKNASEIFSKLIKETLEEEDIKKASFYRALYMPIILLGLKKNRIFTYLQLEELASSAVKPIVDLCIKEDLIISDQGNFKFTQALSFLIRESDVLGLLDTYRGIWSELKWDIFQADALRKFEDYLPKIDDKIVSLAARGYIPNPLKNTDWQGVKGFNRVYVHSFDKKDFSIRYTEIKDLKELELLESLCWPEALQINRKKLKKRIRSFPKGQLVVQKDNKVIGAVYTQRIKDDEAVVKTTMDEVEFLASSEGEILQLLAINVHPDYQHLEIGGMLLEFVLQRATIIKGIKKVIGVTRCRNYPKNSTNRSYDAYIRLKNEAGVLVDPVLNFHHLHGAKIICAIENYRVNDTENIGYGVLVNYDIFDRKKRKKTPLKNDNVYIKNKVEDIKEVVALQIKEILKESYEEEYDNKRPIMEMGIDSSDLSILREGLSVHFNVTLPPVFFFEYNTVEKIVQYLKEEIVLSTTHKTTETITTNENEESFVDNNKYKDDDIAIVGTSFRIPGASTPEEFWALLKKKKDCITEIPSERWDWPNHIDVEQDHKGINRGAFIKNIDQFDASFFRISPREAKLMDPQQRLMLELTWELIERSGYTRSSFKETRTGVFIGASGSDYDLLVKEFENKQDPYSSTATATALLANRISYFFNFYGPSIQIDTACSSSLVALHEAVKSINADDCEQAIIGGTHLMCHPSRTLTYYKAGMLSKDGHCKTFDERANGYVRGEGIVMMLLKPIKKAIEDKDTIHGIIKSSSINHGGQSGGLTVPNPTKQKELLEQAYQKSGISIEDVSYIETHGTGTSLGDPIEFSGLQAAFKALVTDTNNENWCGLGALKTNIGHLEAAAGLAGLLKIVLAMQNKQLPPSLHHTKTNPKINLSNSPFYLINELQAWSPNKNKLLVAGVSSFGIGGANAHVVVQNIDQEEQESISYSDTALFVLSAKNKKQLKIYAENVISYLQNTVIDIHQLCYTYQIAREPMEERLVCEVCNTEELISNLTAYIQDKLGNSVSTGNIKTASTISFEDIEQPILDNLFSDKNHQELLAYWLKTSDFNWEQLYNHKKYKRLEAPTYPFAKERYWVETSKIPKSISNEFMNIPNNHTNAPYNSNWEELITEEALQYQGDEVRLQVVDDTIAVVRMEAKESRNMFSKALIMGLIKTFNQIRNDKNLKVVVLTGYENIFCMGGTEEMLLNIANQVEKFSDTPFFYRGLLEFELPVISAIQGHAYGGGFLFGLYADIVMLSETSTYSANFMKYGFTPGMGATYILGERLGKSLANQMMFTAKPILGEDIKKRGADVIFSNEVIKESLQMAKQLSEKPREALIVLKKELSGRILSELLKHISSEEKMHAKTFSGTEVRNKISGFFKKLSNNKVPKEKIQEVRRTENLQKSVADTPKRSLINLDTLDATVTENEKINVNVVKTSRTDLNGIKQKLKKILEQVIHIDSDTLDEEITFIELGIDSISGVEIIRDVNKELNLQLEAFILYDYYSIQKLSQYILEELYKNDLLDNAAREINEERGARPKITLEDKHETVVKTERISITKIDNEPAFSVIEITQVIKIILQDVIHIDAASLDETTSFIDLGIDSISGVEIVNEINKKFDIGLEAIVLYDFYTIEKLSPLVLEDIQKNDRLTQLLENDQKKTEKKVVTSKAFTNAPAPKTTLSSEPLISPDPILVSEIEKTKKKPSKAKKIAIIGMSGRFPEADNVEQFWENLSKGKSSVKEVPNRKWKIHQYFEEGTKKSGKSASKWMGYLDNEDKFDSLFFNISPIEAERMDPQQRLFLEESWKALEDAGYSNQNLNTQKCGVFVGVSPGDYSDKIKEKEGLDAHIFTGSATSILAARISYFLDLQGPSIAIDTACSSSLVAIHNACQNIIDGSCEVALAGGVYVQNTEKMHIMTSHAGMLSADGQCKTFDNDANGFVIGEAVGVVVLKDLEQAISDNDHIYGVISGYDINQDGKTNGIMAPNVASQERLQNGVYEKFDINPESITYVEAHGTGTKLGDPIEIKALKNAFKKHTNKREYCGIGSVKTNIGHTIAAAGISGVIKVLLSLQHKRLAPSLNYKQLNEHIALENSPFYVVDKLRSWQLDGNIKSRKAAINSFGFSGTNAHLIVEEYIPENRNYIPNTNTFLIPLSAKNPERLTVYASTLLNYIQKNKVVDIASLAWTLQIGRQPMEERLLIVAKDTNTLEEGLQAFLQKDKVDFLYTGDSSQMQKNDFAEMMKYALKDAIANKDTIAIAKMWTNGFAIDWKLLYTEFPKKISLPTYPFAKASHWIISSNFSTENHNTVKVTIVQEPHYGFGDKAYKTIFTGTESFLRDHKVKGQMVLPASAYMEIVRKTAALAYHTNTIQLKNISWTLPLIITQKQTEVHTVLYETENRIQFEVITQEGISAKKKHSAGEIELRTKSISSQLDIPTIKSRNQQQYDGLECYQSFKEFGFDYGESFSCIEKLYTNHEEALTVLKRKEQGDFVLYPGLMDAALQTVLFLCLQSDIGLVLPYAVKEINVYGELPEEVYCYAKTSTISELSFDVDITNTNGDILVSIKEFEVRNFLGFSSKPKEHSLATLVPNWVNESLDTTQEVS
uniref:beta-ketoacyl synthase N-terminal-like domain-containing protein n=1 Tax=Aquimarina aggregata TaxID=1642818 RepID=UPI002491FF1D